MTWVAGVDGCRGGWIVVLLNRRKGRPPVWFVRLCPTFKEVLTLSPSPSVIAVDMPIGLSDRPEPGGRRCDREARRLLGPRASSIFSPPSRPMLAATNYQQVRSKGLSVQAFGILPKIREVDWLMTPSLQRLVYESHPELAFAALAGRPLRFNKKTPQGRRERLRALARAQGKLFQGIGEIARQELGRFPRTQVMPDDLLDAAVLALTALRIANGAATRVPADPPLDRKGLRQEIWY
jgi:predicted RNase H-like nuclease